MAYFGKNAYRIIASSSHPELGKSIGAKLGIPVVETELGLFSNSECMVRFKQSIRGFRTIIVGTGSAWDDRSINDNLWELVLLVQACTLSSATDITVVLPYLPYCRSDKRDERGSIGAKAVVDVLTWFGANRIMCVDLHASQEQAYTGKPFDNLYAIKVFCEHFHKTIFQNLTQDQIEAEFLLVAPDQGGSKRTDAYSQVLGINNIKMNKTRSKKKNSTIEGVSIVGSIDEIDQIKGKICIVIDDIVDTFGTMMANVKVLMDHGAKGIYIVATHGVLSGAAMDRINSCDGVLKVFVTNSLPLDVNRTKCKAITEEDLEKLLTPNGERQKTRIDRFFAQRNRSSKPVDCEKIVEVKIDNLLAAALHAIINGGSVGALFEGDKPIPSDFSDDSFSHMNEVMRLLDIIHNDSHPDSPQLQKVAMIKKVLAFIESNESGL
jgi:ribose-phosphate pyrophosphokinase